MTRFIIAVLVVLAVSGPAWAADYQTGSGAYERGDFATALREWNPLAEQGHALAENNLGVMYYNGQGVPQDYKAAVKWYTLAAKQGSVDAQ